MTIQEIIDEALRVKQDMDSMIDYIPSSWLDDNGVRHLVIFDTSLPDYRRLEKINGQWELVSEPPF